MNDASRHAVDRAMLDLAARVATRACGRVEPNPLVGCVITGRDGRVLSIGHHRRFGGPHAEVEAILAARANGRDVRGATMYVTLEPCTHQGKTPPCTRAILDAGIGEVVVARPDPNPVAQGGADTLRAAGVAVRFTGASEHAARLSDPFVKRVTTGLPWIVAKWAQSLDGRIATRAGDSKWISGERSRATVHRWRSRVDVVMTGIGTVLADDPLLTARRGGTPRRVAHRAVVDASLRTPATSNLVRTAGDAPVVLFCATDAAHSARADGLRGRGVTVVALPDHASGAGLDLAHAMRWLAAERNAMNVLVEAGPALVGSLLRDGLIDECRVFVAPILLGDAAAYQPASVGPIERLADAVRFRPDPPRRSGEDTLLVLRAGR